MISISRGLLTYVSTPDQPTHGDRQGIQSRLLDTKAVGEVQAMGDFFTMLSNQPDRAQYGFNHVKVKILGGWFGACLSA